MRPAPARCRGEYRRRDFVSDMKDSVCECYDRIRALNLPMSLDASKDETKSTSELKEIASGYVQALAVEMVTTLLAISESPISKPRLEWLAKQSIKTVTDVLKRERREKN